MDADRAGGLEESRAGFHCRPRREHIIDDDSGQGDGMLRFYMVGQARIEFAILPPEPFLLRGGRPAEAAGNRNVRTGESGNDGLHLIPVPSSCLFRSRRHWNDYRVRPTRFQLSRKDGGEPGSERFPLSCFVSPDEGGCGSGIPENRDDRIDAVGAAPTAHAEALFGNQCLPALSAARLPERSQSVQARWTDGEIAGNDPLPRQWNRQRGSPDWFRRPGPAAPDSGQPCPHRSAAEHAVLGKHIFEETQRGAEKEIHTFSSCGEPQRD